MTRPALLIIDMQNDFVRSGSPMRVSGAEAAIGHISNVLKMFREKGLPVVHIVRVHRGDGSDVEIIRKDRFRERPFAVEGTEGAAIIPELTPGPGEFIIRKIRMSGFIGTDLDLLLRSVGADPLVVVGIQTPNCIRTTVFDGIAYNYHVWLVDDAVGAQSEEIHRANVRDMENIGVRVLNVQALARELQSA
jgi:nicotinamidase-related amidase